MAPSDRWMGASNTVLNKLVLKDALVLGTKPAYQHDLWQDLREMPLTKANLYVAWTILSSEPADILQTQLFTDSHCPVGWAFLEFCFAGVMHETEQWPLVAKLDELRKLGVKLASSVVENHLADLCRQHFMGPCPGLAEHARQLLRSFLPNHRHRLPNRRSACKPQAAQISMTTPEAKAATPQAQPNVPSVATLQATQTAAAAADTTNKPAALPSRLQLCVHCGKACSHSPTCMACPVCAQVRHEACKPAKRTCQATAAASNMPSLNVCGKACKAVDDFWKGLAKQSEDEGFIQTPDCPTDITVTVTEGLSAAPTQLQRAASCVAKRLLSAFHAVRYVQVGEEQVEVQLIEALIERKHPEWQFQNASTVLVWKGRRRREDKLEEGEAVAVLLVRVMGTGVCDVVYAATEAQWGRRKLMQWAMTWLELQMARAKVKKMFLDAGTPAAHLCWTSSSMGFACIPEDDFEELHLKHTLVHNSGDVVSRLVKPVRKASVLVAKMATVKGEVDIRLRAREAELQIGRGKRIKTDSAKVRDNVEQRDKRARLSLPSTTWVLATASNERNCTPVHKQVLKPTSRKSDRH